MDSRMRIGIDLGGTKIEALAIDKEGRELARGSLLEPLLKSIQRIFLFTFVYN